MSEEPKGQSHPEMDVDDENDDELMEKTKKKVSFDQRKGTKKKKKKERSDISRKMHWLKEESGASEEDYLKAKTYMVAGEDHTLGNALRCILMKDKNVELCGYSMPHPMEDKIHVRLQVNENSSKTVDECLDKGLKSLKGFADKLYTLADSSIGDGDPEEVEDFSLQKILLDKANKMAD